MSKLRNTFRRLIASSLGQRLKGPGIRAAARLGYQFVPLEMEGTFNLAQGAARRGVKAVIDVGGNQGQFGIRLRALGWAGPVLSIEPVPSSFRLLRAVAAKYPPWETVCIAAGSSSGEAMMLISQNSVSSSLLSPTSEHLAAAPHSRVVDSMPVRIDTLDSIVEKSGLQGPFMLKVDTQGYEMEVLRGSEGILDRTTMVQIEVSLRPMYDGQVGWLQLVEFFQSRKFQVIALQPALVCPQTAEVLQLDLVLGRSSEQTVPS